MAGRPTTHGIEISPITFRRQAPGPDITVRAWDFGGQEVYRITHQFFFSPRALYVVVWHARQGQEHDDVEGWLRRIRLGAGRDSRAIIVATHCAEGPPELDYPRLEQLFPGMLAGAFEVDNRTGSGLEALRKAIAEQAARLPQIGQRISPRWVAVREKVLAQAQAEPQISYREFAEISRAAPCHRCGDRHPRQSAARPGPGQLLRPSMACSECAKVARPPRSRA